MESRLRLLLLSAVLPLAGCGLFGGAEAPVDDPDRSAPVISPEVERRDVKPPKVDTENFEVGVFGGLVSVEDFGAETLYGARARYHVTEGLFAEGTYAKANKLGLTSAEVLAGFDLLGNDREYKYWDVALAYKLLPGETFIGDSLAMNSSMYFLLGAGQTSLGPDDYFTLSFGAGYQTLLTDWLALDFGVRDRLYDLEITTGEEKSTHNIELTVGFSVFF